jgi:hypothetical protein
MDRRRFLGLLGGGLVASATMAQADQLAGFMDWLKKGPTAYSFPTNIQIAEAVNPWADLSKTFWINMVYAPGEGAWKAERAVAAENKLTVDIYEWSKGEIHEKI